jgi:hypothetical protein
MADGQRVTNLARILLLTSISFAACSKKPPVDDWTTKPLAVAPRTVGSVTFEAGVPEGLEADPLIKLDHSTTFARPGALLGGIRVTFTVLADVAPATLADAERAANLLGDLKVTKRETEAGRFVVVTTNDKKSILNVDTWIPAVDGRSIHCTASDDEFETPLGNLVAIQSALERICQSVKAPMATPGSRPAASAVSALVPDAGPPVQLPSDVKAFVEALGDEKKNAAAFRAFAKTGVVDDRLGKFSFDSVAVTSAQEAGKTTCYRVLGKIAVGAHAYDICFEGGKILRVTYVGLQ